MLSKVCRCLNQFACINLSPFQPFPIFFIFKVAKYLVLCFVFYYIFVFAFLFIVAVSHTQAWQHGRRLRLAQIEQCLDTANKRACRTTRTQYCHGFRSRCPPAAHHVPPHSTHSFSFASLLDQIEIF